MFYNSLKTWNGSCSLCIIYVHPLLHTLSSVAATTGSINVYSVIVIEHKKKTAKFCLEWKFPQFHPYSLLFIDFLSFWLTQCACVDVCFSFVWICSTLFQFFLLSFELFFWIHEKLCCSFRSRTALEGKRKDEKWNGRFRRTKCLAWIN